MRIAHINNIANVAGRLAEAQRRLGHEVVVCTLYDTPFDFPSDLRIEGAEGPIGFNRAMFSRRAFFSRFDVLHVHGGIWRAQLFYPWIKGRHPRIALAVHYHGSETRMGKGLHHRYAVDGSFHSTPDLTRWLPHSIWIPNPIDVSEPAFEPANPVPRFAQFVSNPAQKGTEAVVDLFQKAFGVPRRAAEGSISKLITDAAELWIVSRVPHTDALRIMASSDVVFDQVSPYGAYGMVAVEAMSLGKPVIGTLNPGWYPGCPIIPFREDMADRLRAVASDPGYRKSLANAGREYVKAVHDSHKVAAEVLRRYERRGAA